jgi:hypothetical protein
MRWIACEYYLCMFNSIFLTRALKLQLGGSCWSNSTAAAQSTLYLP